MRHLPHFLGLAIALAGAAASAGDAERGYRLLLAKPYLPPDFDQETFDEVWREWPEPLRTEAGQAAVEERRRMAFSRYGLTRRPLPRKNSGAAPLQYVVDEAGRWTMNCFACHGGKVAGRVIPGLPNSHYALQTLSEEIRSTKLDMEKPLSRMDLGSMFLPLGTTRGTTNAVMFGVALLANRDAELNLVNRLSLPEMTHHDMDPPPWWHFKKKSHIYIDGFAERGHRGLMQFVLVKENGPEKLRQWEDDFRDIYAYLMSIEAPEYPFEINEALAGRGERAFLKNCAECHGTYGDEETYPNRIVPIEEIGTDRVRLDALTAEARRRYDESWIAEFGRQETRLDPGGYLAPPLDGVWATAPYFHNGSIPTLWHVLHPSERPAIWRRTREDGYDRERVGPVIETFAELPPAAYEPRERREYFDTTRFGKSAAGHHFPDALTEDEKHAVLEYLKTL
ncbi:MAG: c-type cytochrome [Planctomycetes bacterium]|nr:c-type cytochrome [Planctomycetota bacterium]